MSNRIIIKNGENAPPSGALHASELGFDFKNKLLYVGVENNDTQQTENFCLNLEMIKKTDIEFNTEQNYEEILEEGIV